MSAPSSTNSIDLLRRLEPVVRPHAPVAPVDDSGLPFDSQPFESILSRAFAGELQSGQAVGVAADCELQPSLSAAQMHRLAVAADRAEAAGARRAMMMIDGRGVVMDVASRSIVAELKPQRCADVLRLDAAMVVPDTTDAVAGARTNGFAAHSVGLPFAGINDLTAARLASASIAPKPR